MVEPIWLEKSWPQYASTEVSPPEIPLFEMLQQTARQYPESPFLSFLGRDFTFQEVDDMSSRFARALQNLGLKKGDRVHIYMPNTAFYPIALFGILKAGCISVGSNPLYTTSELLFQVTDTKARAIIVLDHPDFYRKVKEVQQQAPELEHVIYGKMEDVVGLPPEKARQMFPSASDKDANDHDFMELVRNNEPLTSFPDVNPNEDVAILLYTGGTTGFPKGAMLTHYNLVVNVYQMNEMFWPRPTPGKDSMIGALPFFHAFGLVVVLLYSTKYGVKVIIVPDPRAGDPPFTHLLELIHRYRPIYFHGVPTLYNALLHNPKINDYDLTSIKACLSGAAPLPVELMKKWEEKTGANLVEGYGMTELSPVATVNPMDGNKKAGSIGIPIPNTLIKIVDVDDPTKEMPIGEQGELAVKGPQVMKGYWQRPEETAKIMTKDGFLLTGDVGYMDEDGFFYITDRKKDMINASGLKVFPREVEEVLFKHPAILNAAVIGVPDEHRGETVKAVIVVKPGHQLTEDEVKEFCRQHLAPYKVPKHVEFRETLPLSAVGKVLRRVLKEEAIKK